MTSLDGITQKIIRAQEHLTAIIAQVDGHKQKCRIVSQKNAQSGMVDFIADFPDPPLPLSIIVGDCLHNLRSSLDHLIWQLVECSPPNHGIARNQFPICRDSVAFQRELKGHRLDGVPPKAQTLIESLQPYHWGVQEFSDHPLWHLDQLVNIDKHRFLPLTSVLAQDMLGKVTYPSGAIHHQFSWVGGQIHSDKAVIFSVRVENLALGEEMKVQLQSGLSIAFKDASAAGRDVGIVMQSILEYIGNHVIPTFKPFLN